MPFSVSCRARTSSNPSNTQHVRNALMVLTSFIQPTTALNPQDYSVRLYSTCRILSCAAGVFGVLRAMLLLVTLYSDSRVLEAEFVIPDSSAVWRAISLAWPTFTTSSSSVSDICKRKTTKNALSLEKQNACRTSGGS